MSLASLCGESGLSVTMSTPYSAAAAFMRGYRRRRDHRERPAHAMADASERPGLRLVLAVEERDHARSVLATTAVLVRLRMAARMTADIASLRRGMSKRSVPSR